jgi:hypothetical protein
MPIWIAHRGNTHGRDASRENDPEYIERALDSGFDVEIDVWLCDDMWYLGHDDPQYPVEISFLERDRVWCHAKNAAAAARLAEIPSVHHFVHDVEPCVRTSRGIDWTYIGEPVRPDAVCVMPELASAPPTIDELACAYGVCSDRVAHLKRAVRCI